MTYYGSEEHEPVTYVRGHPVYAAHLVMLTFVVSMIVTAILMGLGMDWIGVNLAFDSPAVTKGEVWRIFTYGLWNPPSLWFGINMLMLVWFGREVEKTIGRRKFLVLFACIYLIQSVLFTILAPWLPVTFAGETGSFAIFIAFATLFPNVPLFFALLAKWVAVILVGLYTLMALAARNNQMLISLWSTTAFAYAFVRYNQGVFTLPKLRIPRRTRKFHASPTVPSKEKSVIKPAARQPAPNPASMAEVDALLDKIAAQGIGSLTARERAKLDAARNELKRRAGG